MATAIAIRSESRSAWAESRLKACTFESVKELCVEWDEGRKLARLYGTTLQQALFEAETEKSHNRYGTVRRVLSCARFALRYPDLTQGMRQRTLQEVGLIISEDGMLLPEKAERARLLLIKAKKMTPVGKNTDYRIVQQAKYGDALGLNVKLKPRRTNDPAIAAFQRLLRSPDALHMSHKLIAVDRRLHQMFAAHGITCDHGKDTP